MAWKELLLLHDTQPEEQPRLGDGETKDRAGLIRQVCAQFGQTVDGDPATAETAAQEPVRCADGYVRRSPVQPSGTAEDFTRRRTRRIVMIALAAVFAVLLIYALMRSGLLVFRLR